MAVALASGHGGAWGERHGKKISPGPDPPVGIPEWWYGPLPLEEEMPERGVAPSGACTSLTA